MKTNKFSLGKQFRFYYDKAFGVNEEQLKLYKIFKTRKYHKLITTDSNSCYFEYFKFENEEVMFENENKIVDLKKQKIFTETGFFYYIETLVIEKHFYYRSLHGYSKTDAIDFYWQGKELK